MEIQICMYSKKRIELHLFYTNKMMTALLLFGLNLVPVLAPITQSTDTTATTATMAPPATPSESYICVPAHLTLEVSDDASAGLSVPLHVNCSNWSMQERKYLLDGNFSDVNRYFMVSAHNDTVPHVKVISGLKKNTTWLTNLIVLKYPYFNETMNRIPLTIVSASINDPPRILPETIDLNVSENVPVGTVLTVFSATDPDDGMWGNLTAFGIDLPSGLEVDPMSFELLVRSPLDVDIYSLHPPEGCWGPARFEEKPVDLVQRDQIGVVFEFQVGVKDGGGLFALATVSLTVKDVNDNAPVCRFNVTVKTSRQLTLYKGPLVALHDYCNDSDYTWDNNCMSGALLKENCSGTFISSYDGIQQFSTVPENYTSCSLVVNIMDTGVPILSTTFTVTIEFAECPAGMDYLGRNWTVGEPGRNTSGLCPNGFNGRATRYCDKNGVYHKPVYDCTNDGISRILNKVRFSDNFNLSQELTNLSNLTGKSSPANGTLLLGDVRDVNIIMDRVTDLIKETDFTKIRKIADPFLDVADNIIGENTTTTWKILIDQTGEGANMVFSNIDRFVEKVVHQTGNRPVSAEFQKTNLYLKLGSSSACENSIRFPERDKGSTVPKWAEKTRDAVEIDCLQDTSVRAYSSVLYRNVTQLIPTTRKSAQNKTVEEDMNAPVISFAFLPKLQEKLDNPIRLTFQLFTEKRVVSPTCSYWESKNRSNRGYWSSTGCWLDSYNKQKGIVVCKCDHLTNFAVLTSPALIGDEGHHLALSIISLIGCIISMIALCLTVTTHIYFWRKVKSVRSIININLCCFLFFAYLIFLVGIDKTDSKNACTAVAVLLHFTFLAAFFIMLTEGLNLAYTVLKPLSTRKPGIPLLFIGYALSAVIVGVSMGVVQLKGYGTDTSCWLSTTTGLIWAFNGPVLVIIALNFVIIGIVIWKMCGTVAMSRKTTSDRAKAGIRSVLVLMPLMGLTWLFGMFSLSEDAIFFQYIFAILNSIQGLLIFIFHCVLNRKIREAFKQKKFKWMKVSASSEASKSKATASKSTSETGI